MPSYSYKLKLDIINDFNDGLTRNDIIDKYKPKYKTLTRYRTDTWIRNRELILSMKENAKIGKCLTQFKIRSRIDSVRKTKLGVENENKLDKWIVNKRNAGDAISNKNIKTQAIKLARESGIDDFFASNGWLRLFKKRKDYVMRRVTKANKITAEKKESVISDFHTELNEKEKFTDFFLKNYGMQMKQ